MPNSLNKNAVEWNKNIIFAFEKGVFPPRNDKKE